MTNSRLIWHAVACARECQHMRLLRLRLDQPEAAANEAAFRDYHMAHARMLKANDRLECAWAPRTMQ